MKTVTLPYEEYLSLINQEREVYCKISYGFNCNVFFYSKDELNQHLVEENSRLSKELRELYKKYDKITDNWFLKFFIKNN